MKTLLFTIIAMASMLSYAQDDISNITCALKNGAKEVIQLSHIGEEVYRMKRFKSSRYAKPYNQQTLRGRLVELVDSSDNYYQLTYRVKLSEQLDELTEDVTTGSFPNARRARTKLNQFKCTVNYSKDLTKTIRSEVNQDINQ